MIYFLGVCVVCYFGLCLAALFLQACSDAAADAKRERERRRREKPRKWVLIFAAAYFAIFIFALIINFFR